MIRVNAVQKIVSPRRWRWKKIEFAHLLEPISVRQFSPDALMSAPRSFVLATPTCADRSSVELSLHSRVDSILKALKSCSRRVDTALSAHKNELHVLQRLYYKGKNQHRSALFWRRVEEMRKYGSRLGGTKVDEIVSCLRASFFGATSLPKLALVQSTRTRY